MKLTIFNFAYNNITRDFKTYLYHFISCVFSVFIFFLFSTLTMHPVLKVVKSTSTVGIVLMVASIISVIFSFTLILYSISNFLRNRSKQFAILNIIGSSKKQFKQLIFLENIILSIIALLVGLITGIIFSKFFLMLAEGFIGGLNLYFYFPYKALVITVLTMGTLFLLVSIIAPIILRKKKVIDLLKKEEVEEKNRLGIAIFSLIVLLPITIWMHINMEDSMIIYPFYLLSYIGITFFAFHVIYMIYDLVMKKSGKIYRNNNLVKVSNFRYKINTNIKTMTGAMILFSVILTAFVYIIGAPTNVMKDTKKIMPYAYMYQAWEPEINVEKKAEILHNELKNEEGIKKLVISYGRIKDKKETSRHILLSESMYNDIAEFLNREKVKLKKNEYFLVGVDGKKDPVLFDEVRQTLQEHDIKKENGKEKRIIALSGYFTSVTVVDDEKYEEISKTLDRDKLYAFDKKDFRNNKEELKILRTAIGFEEGKETLASAYWYYQNENLTRRIVAYVGSILCVSFLIGIASIIYSRLYSLVEEESKKYSIMMKIGLSKKELKEILASTLKWIFIVPFLIALILSWIFVLLMNQVTMTSYIELTAICSSIYILVEFILYIAIKRKYERKILGSIYEM